MLEYKEDWEETKERYRLWWNGEYFGRCGLWVTAPKDDAPDEAPPESPEDPVERWTDLDHVSALNAYEHRRTFYGGEAFPVWHPGYPGHVAIPAFLGCPLHLDHRTGWWDPFLLDEEWDVGDLELNRNNKWFRFGLKMLRRAAADSAGMCIPSIGAFGGSGDCLAALRGTDRLLLDVLDQPEKVAGTEEHLMDLWMEVYDTFYGIIREASDDGSTCYFKLWAPGKFYSVSNDFSYMISPDMYEELFLPVIRRQTEFLDYSVYHVDGIGSFNHVPLICGMPRLQALQILPGAGKPSPLHYSDVLHAVQDAGKNLQITIPPEEVEPALDMLSARGLMIRTETGSESEARRLLELAERKSKP